MNRRGLGRGLGALLSSTPAEGEALLEVPIDAISPNPHQPRKSFDSNGLSELTASIRTSGLIQPVVVRRQGQGYQLIAGELGGGPRSSPGSNGSLPSFGRRPTVRAWSSP